MSERKTGKDSGQNNRTITTSCPHCGASFSINESASRKSGATVKLSTYGIWGAVVVVLLLIGWLVTPSPKDPHAGHDHESEAAVASDMSEMPDGHPPIEGNMDGKMSGAASEGSSEGMPDGHPTVEGGEPMPADIMQKFTDFKQKVEANPKDTDALRELGNMYYDIGWAERAIEYYSRYLAIIPDDGFVLNDIGRMYIAIDDLDTATKSLNRAIEIDPTLPQPYVNLGLAYAGQGHYEEAVVSLEKAVAVSKDPVVTDGAKSLIEQVKKALAEETAKSG